MTIIATDLLSHNNIPSVSVVEITPETARQWLERNFGNRPIRKSAVAKYERFIREGKWKMAGDPIRFSNTGKLVDGQHRLHAIAASGIAVTCVVMRGFDDDIFAYLDGGIPRQRHDLIAVKMSDIPVETAKMLSTCAVFALDYERGITTFSGRADKTDVLSFVESHPEMIASAEYAQALPRSAPVRRSIAAFFHFHASKRDRAAAEIFLKRFMVGAVDGENDMLLHLRNLCISFKSRGRSITTPDVIGKMIKIWNAEQKGKPYKSFSGTYLRGNEAFPTFI